MDYYNINSLDELGINYTFFEIDEYHEGYETCQYLAITLSDCEKYNIDTDNAIYILCNQVAVFYEGRVHKVIEQILKAVKS